MEIAVLKYFQCLRAAAPTAFFGALSLIGETEVFIAVFLTLMIVLRGERKKVLFFAVLFSLALNVALKFTFCRPRPYIADGIVMLQPPLSRALYPYTSFPSGHVQLVATLCASLVGKRKGSLLFLPLPVFVGLARLYFGVHYPSDVIFGLFFGFASVLVVRALILLRNT